jgi:hypothetical protein
MQNIQKMHNVHVNHPKKGSKWGIYKKPRGTVWIKSIQIRWFSGQSDMRLKLLRGIQKYAQN